MTQPASFSDRVRAVFQPVPDGVVGLVDRLLGLGREHPLRLGFEGDGCCVRRLDAGTDEPVAVPLPKSVFRALIARVAALCNETVPNSVTPYRGDGVLSAAGTFSVSFVNTPDEQRLDVGLGANFETTKMARSGRRTTIVDQSRLNSPSGFKPPSSEERS